MVEFENEVKFYGLWSVKKQQWVEEHDGCFAGLIYSESLGLLNSKVEHIFYDYDYSAIEIKGSLDGLSAQPVDFIASND